MKLARKGECAVPPSSPAGLHIRIKALCTLLLKIHYYEEANWVWMAAASPQSCRSPKTREVLQDAASLAVQLGFADVAHWIRSEVL
jgi:hypothetical protein